MLTSAEREAAERLEIESYLHDVEKLSECRRRAKIDILTPTMRARAAREADEARERARLHFKILQELRHHW